MAAGKRWRSGFEYKAGRVCLWRLDNIAAPIAVASTMGIGTMRGQVFALPEGVKKYGEQASEQG